VAGEDDFRAQTLFQTGLLLWWMGDFSGSLSMLDQAVPLMHRSGDVIGSAMTEGYIAANHASLGNFEEADRRMAISRELAEQADALARLDFQLAEAGLAGQRGDFGTSVRHAGECLGSAVELGALGCATVAGTILGASQVGSGSAAQARVSLQRTLELATQGFLVPVRMRASVFLSSAQALGGELGLAKEGFSTVIDDISMMGSPYGEAEAKLQRGLVLASHPDGDPTSALADLEEAGAVFERLGARPALARALRGQAMALTRLGREAQADNGFAEAAGMANEMGLMDGPWPVSVEALHAAAGASAPLQMIE
jgi:hypothetical protein